MKNKKILFALVGTLLSVPASTALAQTLSGDEKVSCQCVLCLSSGTRPSACTPPLTKYFSIKAKKWKDTIKKRQDFLEICPASSSTPQMRSLVLALSRGAGQCDPASLNRTLTTYTLGASNFGGSNNSFMGSNNAFQTNNFGIGGSHNSNNNIKISNVMPAYCSAYVNHEYTDLNSKAPKYVGTPSTGGYWVEAGNYQAELTKYNSRKQCSNIWNIGNCR